MAASRKNPVSSINLSYPEISITPPGPLAQKLLKKDQRYISPSYTRVYPLFVKRAAGCMVEDVDGNRYLDMTAGIAVCLTGHCHPKIQAAITEQAANLIHMSGTDFYYPQQSQLAERLDKLTPGEHPKRTYFGNSGAESVEAAFKLARWHSKRPLILAFLGAFHGRTLGALSLTASKAVQRRHFSPLIPGVKHAPYAYCYRCPHHLTYPKCGIFCLTWIKEELFNKILPPEEVAAIFLEPIQGEGGLIVPPKEFVQGLRKLAHDYGILLVDDEIQAGMGRTGKFAAIEHYQVIPDIVCLAKGIASGLPLSATLAHKDIMDWGPGTHASTFGGNPVSCAAALATLDLLEANLMENARVVGEYFKGELLKLQKETRLIGEVRGLGLMLGVELVKDGEKKTPAVEERNKIVQACFQRGLLLLGCGQNAIRFIPPLIITREEVDRGLAIFAEVLKKF